MYPRGRGAAALGSTAAEPHSTAAAPRKSGSPGSGELICTRTGEAQYGARLHSGGAAPTAAAPRKIRPHEPPLCSSDFNRVLAASSNRSDSSSVGSDSRSDRRRIADDRNRIWRLN